MQPISSAQGGPATIKQRQSPLMHGAATSGWLASKARKARCHRLQLVSGRRLETITAPTDVGATRFAAALSLGKHAAHSRHHRAPSVFAGSGSQQSPRPGEPATRCQPPRTGADHHRDLYVPRLGCAAHRSRVACTTRPCGAQDHQRIGTVTRWRGTTMSCMPCRTLPAGL